MPSRRPSASKLPSTARRPTFIDVFSGCGGLSLGLKRSGWEGLFAVEKDSFSFATLRANFLSPDSRYKYAWPSWLAARPWSIEALLKEHRAELTALRGSVDLVAGGPPCQGFSSAGRRRADDPRNALVEHYLALVAIVQPRFLLLENVRGITIDFKTGSGPRRPNAAAGIIAHLAKAYRVETTVLIASRYGVPQTRPRFFLLGVRRDLDCEEALLGTLLASREVVLHRHDLPRRTTARQALSDLEIARNTLRHSRDTPGFEEIGYTKPRTRFQRAMRDGFDGAPSDTRLARHSIILRERFSAIIELCHEQERSTRQLTPAMRDQLGVRKVALRVLDPLRPAPTITSMPDDLLHYSEPRTLTVRENARLQTFPDWFIFQGKYTSGGHLRRLEVPRFTQVANAVPPLLAEILGETMHRRYTELQAVSATPSARH